MIALEGGRFKRYPYGVRQMDTLTPGSAKGGGEFVEKRGVVISD